MYIYIHFFTIPLCNSQTQRNATQISIKIKKRLGHFFQRIYVHQNDGAYHKQIHKTHTPQSLEMQATTLEEPLEYICIIFSAPCFTLSSMSACFFRAASRLLLVHVLDSLLGVSGVSGHSDIEKKHTNLIKH